MFARPCGTNDSKCVCVHSSHSQWCWVDHAACSVVHAPSAIHGGRFWSYAACGNVDFWSDVEVVAPLLEEVAHAPAPTRRTLPPPPPSPPPPCLVIVGARVATQKQASSPKACPPPPQCIAPAGCLGSVQKILKVGYRSNTGGWKGAYHPLGNKGLPARDEMWTGPSVEFAAELVKAAGAVINITDIPQAIIARSGSSSVFNQCVYAVSLGYLDMCARGGGRVGGWGGRGVSTGAPCALGLRSPSHPHSGPSHPSFAGAFTGAWLHSLQLPRVRAPPRSNSC